MAVTVTLPVDPGSVSSMVASPWALLSLVTPASDPASVLHSTSTPGTGRSLRSSTRATSA